MRVVRFNLKDRAGKSHAYEVELFTCDENVRFQLMLSIPVLEVVGRAVASLVPAVQAGAVKALVSGDFGAVAAALSHIDWLTAPAALGPLPKMIEDRGGAGFVAEIWANTSRLVPVPEAQGLPTISETQTDGNLRYPLSESAHRDAIFGDGNFKEYWSAVAMVLIVNFTHVGRTGSIDWRELVETLTGGLLTRSQADPETAPQSNDSTIGNASQTH